MNKTFTILITLLVSLPIYARGTSSGGGGVGVRCPLSNGKTSLETLDIHESKLKGMKYKLNPNSLGDAIDLSSKLVATHYFSGRFEYLSQYIEFMKKRFFKNLFLGRPVKESDTGNWIHQKYVSHLNLSNDYGNYQIKPECHLEQIAFFNDKKSILFINKTLFDEMNYLHQAVLITHEMIYFLERNYPSLHDLNSTTKRTSEVTRHFAGKLYSHKGTKTKLRVSEQTKSIVCENNTSDPNKFTEFRVFPNLDGTFSLLLNDSHGHTSPFRISSVIDFDPAHLINFDAEFKSYGEFTISDFVTNNLFYYEVEKKAWKSPIFRVLKNNDALGSHDEVTCTLSN